MQELEKVLEEIDAIKTGFDTECASECDFFDWSCGACVGECDEYIKEKVKEIIRKHMNDGWIPVEERLPEEYGEYLVTIVPSAGCLWAKRIIANFSDLMGIIKKPIFYTGEVGKIDFEDIADMVIAWHPLPEPYHAERSRE